MSVLGRLGRVAVARSSATRTTGRRGMAKAVRFDDKKTFNENWLQDPTTYPVIAVIIGACTLAAVKMTRDLFAAPEIHLSKTERSTIDFLENERNGESMGASYSSHRHVKGNRQSRERHM